MGSKLVILKIGDGNFEQGFPVTLQLGDEGEHPSVEVVGQLPPNSHIPQHYRSWQSAYYRLGLCYRLEASNNQVTHGSYFQDCRSTAQALLEHFNVWLRSASLQLIREAILEHLDRADDIRVLLQVRERKLQRLPWHLWDLLERYPNAEIALSAPAYKCAPPSPPKAKVRVLAILGNSTGIDTQSDQALLQQLPKAEVQFLVEPPRKALTEQLWQQQGWDILFFAGHSSSQTDGEAGRMHLNQTDSLTIEELRFALKKAVERGLKLVILNSCDGLGLAQGLADLCIPQIIVMREPIPDRVAQEFLKYFLESFARGEPFYLSVKEAREKLQGLEDQFPCASWLPIICQNPAETPPTWHGLRGVRQPKRLNHSRSPGLSTVALLSLTIASFMVGIRYLGALQPWELKAFDHLMRLRPPEPPDARILVVTISEKDIQAQDPKQRQGSLSDRTLIQLLDKLESYQPRTIGLDLYREGVSREQAARLRQNQRLFAVCKASYAPDPEIPPPSGMPDDRIGFSDFISDDDEIVRRQLISMDIPPTSFFCRTRESFNYLIALHYLTKQGVKAGITANGELQLNQVVFKKLTAHTGGYQAIDDQGYQLLLNYRSSSDPQTVATQVSLEDILTKPIDPSLIRDRIVLIGTIATSSADYWLTPYSAAQVPDQKYTPGVLMQAQMISQMLSTVLDGRPLLWSWALWGDAIWIWSWSAVGGLLAYFIPSRRRLGLAGVGATGVLYGLCFGLLLQGGWVPLLPTALALCTTAGGVVVYRRLASGDRGRKPRSKR